MNYLAKIIVDTDEKSPAELNKRSKGDTVYISIQPEGSVLVYDKFSRDRAQVIGMFPSVDEAKQYLTCIEKTKIDVQKIWKDALNERYF